MKPGQRRGGRNRAAVNVRGQSGILTNDGKVIFALHLSVGHMHACLPFCH